MKTNGRDSRGRFAVGHAGGPGRPALPKEQKYLATLSGTVSEDDWQEICATAVGDAKAGDHRARDWLSKYLLPNSEQIAELHLHQHLNTNDGNSWLEHAPPESIIEFLTSVRRLKASCEIDER